MPSASITSQSSHVIDLTGTAYAELADRIPATENKHLVFEISGANCALANAIRRTLLSEMPVPHLTVSLVDIVSTDPYIIGEVIRKRLEMIPVSLDIDRDAVFSLKIENDSDEVIDVLSDSIRRNGVSASKHIMTAIPLCDINAGTSFVINDIHVVESYGFDNARATIGRVGYSILDQDFQQPAAVSNPTHFKMELEVAGVLDPKRLVLRAIDGLVERVDNIDFGAAIREFDVYKLTIDNETHSVMNLLSWYIYQLEPTIEYCGGRIPHPSTRSCVIDVRHPAAEDLCRKAIAKIKSDLAEIRGAFA